MSFLSAWLTSARTLLDRGFSHFRRGALDRELDEELQSHLAFATDEFREQGLSDDEARLAALRSFGGVTQIRENVRLREGWPFLENLRRDLFYAMRQMRRSPAFAASVITTLALGIGAAAAMFTVVDHVLLQPLSYRDPGRLVQIEEVDRHGRGVWPLPWLDIEQWTKQSRSFDQIAFSSGMEGRNYLEGKTSSLQIDGEQVSVNIFQLLGARPLLGRGFLPDTPGFGPGKNAGTVVLSNAVWQQAFGGNPSVLGKVVKINGAPYTVAGVMPPWFRYPVGASNISQVWVPIQLGKEDRERGDKLASYFVIARLRSGASLRSASAEMAVIQKRLGTQYPTADMRQDHSAVKIQRYSDTLVDADTRKALLALLAASALLWLIASLNATNLLLARSMARQREMAMRRALGANRWRVVQQMLVEALLLSGLAGTLGIGLALCSVKLLQHELAQHLPLPAPATPDTSILAALLGMTLISALLAAVWPALIAARAPIEPALKQGGLQTGTLRRHNRLRGTLVAAEIAMSLTLLAVCGLLLRTIYSVRHIPLGYRTDHILVASLSIPSYRFAGRNMTQDLYQPLLERVQHLHGVDSAGLMTDVPLSRNFLVNLTLSGDDRIGSLFKAVTPEVQQVFAFHMAAGRYFNLQDTPTSQPVAIVNEAFAHLHSPDKNNPNAVIGTQLINLRKNAPTRIIGILADERQGRITGPPSPEVEISIRQITPDSNFYEVTEGIAMELAVRTEQPTSAIIPEIRDILRQASPELADATITTMDQIVEDSYGSQRLAAHLLEIFGGSALLLCVAGLYGLLAYVVNQRTRELGVRIALGAQRGNLLWMVLRQAAVMLFIGVAIGTALAWASGRLVGGFLYGVSAHDGWTLAGAALLLLTCGLFAAWLPARRAAGVDPMTALRTE